MTDTSWHLFIPPQTPPGLNENSHHRRLHSGFSLVRHSAINSKITGNVIEEAVSERQRKRKTNTRKASKTFWKFFSPYSKFKNPPTHHLTNALLKNVSLVHLGFGKIISQIWVSVGRINQTAFAICQFCACSVLKRRWRFTFGPTSCMSASCNLSWSKEKTTSRLFC